MFNHGTRQGIWLGLFAVWFLGVPTGGRTQVVAQIDRSNAPETTSDTIPGDDLSVEQAQLADRYDRLEQIITRLAELTAASDPHRAKLLREALSQAGERDMAVRFEGVVQLLEYGQLTTASQNQTELIQDLQEMLQLLLKENRGDELASQQKWLRKQLKEIGRIIRLQRGVKARTEGGDDTRRLVRDQQEITDQTDRLADKIEAEGDPQNGGGQQDGGQPGDGAQQDGGKQGGSQQDGGQQDGGQQDGGQQGDGGQQDGGQQGSGQQGSGQQDGSGQQGESGEAGKHDAQPSAENPYDQLQGRIRAAQQNMEEAQQRLAKAEREGAAEDQERALRELEQAKADLERILRQLREEEMERALALLEVRFRKMLDMQLEVYEGTQRLDRVPQTQRNHDDEIEAGRLSRQEAAIVLEADKVILLLQEEGTSVAFPEAVEQMREDMQEIVNRLIQIQVDEITQDIEKDVIEALEEAIAAVQKALADLEKNRTPPGESPPPGVPQDPPLVDQLAELKMIRALQARIKRRTERYSQAIEGSQALQADMISALSRLAERQEQIEKATRDLHTGRNQ